MANVDLAAVAVILEKLYPWVLLRYEPSETGEPLMSEPEQSSCVHQWSAPWRNWAHLARVCTRCGRAEVRPHPGEPPDACFERSLRIVREAEVCHACGRRMQEPAKEGT